MLHFIIQQLSDSMAVASKAYLNDASKVKENMVLNHNHVYEGDQLYE